MSAIDIVKDNEWKGRRVVIGKTYLLVSYSRLNSENGNVPNSNKQIDGILILNETQLASIYAKQSLNKVWHLNRAVKIKLAKNFLIQSISRADTVQFNLVQIYYSKSSSWWRKMKTLDIL